MLPRDLLRAGSVEDFWRAFDYFQFVNLRFYDEREKEAFFDVAKGFGLTREELMEHYVSLRQRAIRQFGSLPQLALDARDAEKIAELIEGISLFDLPIPEEVLRGVLPSIEPIVQLALERGTKTAADLEGLVATFEPLLPDFRERVARYETQGAINIVKRNIIYGMHDPNIVDSIRKLRSANKLADLEDKLRIAAAYGIAEPQNSIPLRVLQELGWQNHIDEIYGGVIINLNRPIPVGALGCLIELDKQNQLPPYLAMIMARQTQLRDNILFDNQELVDFLRPRMGESSPQLMEMAQASLKSTIMSRLERAPDVERLEYYLPLIRRRVFRVTARQACGLVNLYNNMFGHLNDPILSQKADPLIRFSLKDGEYRPAYDLALAIAGSTDKIEVSHFNERVKSIPELRENVLTPQRDPFGFGGERRTIGEIVQQLRELATELYVLDASFGERLTYRTRDEILAIAKEMNERTKIPMAYYFCLLFCNYQKLPNAPDGNPIQNSLFLQEINRVLRRNYQEVSSNRRIERKVAVDIRDTYKGGYTALFKRSIEDDVKTAKREPIRDGIDAYQPKQETPKVPRRITIYFGGKNFPPIEQEDAVRQKVGRISGGLEVAVGEISKIDGRGRFAYITITPDDYPALCSRTGFNTSVQAIVLVNYASKIDPQILERARLQAVSDGDKIVISNAQGLQTLTIAQLEWIRRALSGENYNPPGPQRPRTTYRRV